MSTKDNWDDSSDEEGDAPPDPLYEGDAPPDPLYVGDAPLDPLYEGDADSLYVGDALPHDEDAYEAKDKRYEYEAKESQGGVGGYPPDEFVDAKSSEDYTYKYDDEGYPPEEGGVGGYPPEDDEGASEADDYDDEIDKKLGRYVSCR